MGKIAVERARREEFGARWVALVEEFRDVLGPAIDPVTNDICGHEVDEDCPCAVPPDVMSTEWITLLSWVDMSNQDRSWSTAQYAPHMLRSHKLGLLYSHVKDM